MHAATAAAFVAALAALVHAGPTTPLFTYGDKILGAFDQFSDIKCNSEISSTVMLSSNDKPPNGLLDSKTKAIKINFVIPERCTCKSSWSQSISGYARTNLLRIVYVIEIENSVSHKALISGSMQGVCLPLGGDGGRWLLSCPLTSM